MNMPGGGPGAGPGRNNPLNNSRNLPVGRGGGAGRPHGANDG